MRFLTLWACLILSSISGVHVRAAMYSYSNPYPGNGAGAANSPVGHGSLTWGDNGTTLQCIFTPGSTVPSDYALVLYIDSVAGGFSSTSAFSDYGNPTKAAISGYKLSGASHSTATFASGFGADYALVIEPSEPNYNAVYSLDAGGSLTEVVGSSSLGYTDNGVKCSVSFDWSKIGVGTGAPKTLNFESTYINVSTSTGRTLESFEGFANGSQSGWNSVMFANYDRYPVAAVPEPVSMALGIFGGMFVVVSRIRRWRRLRGGARE